MYTSCKGGFYMKKFFSFIFCLFITCCSVLCVSANFPNNREIIHLTSESDPTLRLCAPDIECKVDIPFMTNVRYCTWPDGEGIRGCTNRYGRKGHWVAHLIDAGSHTYVLQNYATYSGMGFLDALTTEIHENTLVLDETVTTGRACCWSRHDGLNQQWVFEPLDTDLIKFRLRNKATGHYLTMNSADSKCVGWHWVNDRDRNYEYQIWEKH